MTGIADLKFKICIENLEDMGQTERAKRTERTFIEEARRAQILDAAQKIFLKRGFEKSSVAEIADAIGVSKGVILYHFGNKAELGKAVLEAALQAYGDHITQHLQQLKTGKTKLLAFPGVCAEYIETHRDGFLLYIDTLGSFGDADHKRAFMAEADQTQRKYLMSIIDECKAEGFLARINTQHLADTIQAFVDGIMSQYCANSKHVDVRASARHFTNMLKTQFND